MSPIVSTQELLALLSSEAPLRLIDCRFSLAQPSAGAEAYQSGHIPAAVYADLEKDLSGPVIPQKTGRHPLPSIEALTETFSRLGIDSATRVVAYDDGPGAFASRLWWLLRYLGHDSVQVLDGGLAAYVASGGKLEAGQQHAPRLMFVPAPRPEMIAEVEEVEERSRSARPLLFDARAADRFRGENETIDPIVGHIPGAVSLPFLENLRDGKLRPASELKERWMGACPGSCEHAIVYCGSGVTACHNLLSAEVAGITGVRLYPGSYSEWIASGERPVATGA